MCCALWRDVSGQHVASIVGNKKNEKKLLVEKMCSDEQHLDFVEFIDCLSSDKVAKAITMVTTRNMHSRYLNRGVVSVFCENGPDDPELLRHFVGLSAVDVLGANSLHWAASSNKPRVLRALIDMGGNVNLQNTHDGSSPLEWTSVVHYECAKVLLDAGAKCKMNCMSSWEWKKFLSHREKARIATIAILCLPRCQQLLSKSKDVLRIVARCVWSTRGHREWIK